MSKLWTNSRIELALNVAGVSVGALPALRIGIPVWMVGALWIAPFALSLVLYLRQPDDVPTSTPGGDRLFEAGRLARAEGASRDACGEPPGPGRGMWMLGYNAQCRFQACATPDLPPLNRPA